jgi:hypothetical protein
VNYPIAQGPLTWVEGANPNGRAIGDGHSFTLGAKEFTYNGKTTTWGNLEEKIAAVKAITQSTTETTLNINNSISIQNGETTSSPNQHVIISSDASGNRLALNGDYGTSGYVLTSGGETGTMIWGTGGGGSVGTLGDVLNNDNVANMSINMNGNDLENIGKLKMIDSPMRSNELNSTGTVFSITMAGQDYFIPLFTNL